MFFLLTLSIQVLIVFPATAQDKVQSQPEQMRGIFDDALYVEPEEKQKQTAVIIDDFEKPSKYNLLGGE